MNNITSQVGSCGIKTRQQLIVDVSIEDTYKCMKYKRQRFRVIDIWNQPKFLINITDMKD